MTETILEQPGSSIVTPYITSAVSIVRLLWVIAMNCVSWVMSRSRRVKSRTHTPSDGVAGESADSPWAAEPEDPERLLLERELHEAMERAIADLDAASAEAIGTLLGRAARPAVSEVAFRKRISRAYARLRVLLGGFDGR